MTVSPEDIAAFAEAFANTQSPTSVTTPSPEDPAVSPQPESSPLEVMPHGTDVAVPGDNGPRAGYPGGPDSVPGA